MTSAITFNGTITTETSSGGVEKGSDGRYFIKPIFIKDDEIEKYIETLSSLLLELRERGKKG